MNTRLAIIRSEGKEHLCYREEECFVDVSYPMVTFTKGEDDFEIAKCDHPSMEETFLYQESRLSIVIEMYHNGWPALSLKDPVTHEIYTVLTVNLEDKAAYSAALTSITCILSQFVRQKELHGIRIVVDVHECPVRQ